LVLGEADGYLEVFAINDSVITHTQHFGGLVFNDIQPINGGYHFLLAGDLGLLKTTIDMVLAHYFKDDDITSICHVAGSRYLLGVNNYGLIMWNEHTD
jgi:hypothetical protein